MDVCRPTPPVNLVVATSSGSHVGESYAGLHRDSPPSPSRTQEVSDKRVRACFRRSARLTSTWALTLTAIVEVDVAVDVEPIVDLDVDRRVRSSS
jgi:hypothetical protein